MSEITAQNTDSYFQLGCRLNQLKSDTDTMAAAVSGKFFPVDESRTHKPGSKESELKVNDVSIQAMKRHMLALKQEAEISETAIARFVRQLLKLIGVTTTYQQILTEIERVEKEAEVCVELAGLIVQKENYEKKITKKAAIPTKNGHNPNSLRNLILQPTENQQIKHSSEIAALKSYKVSSYNQLIKDKPEEKESVIRQISRYVLRKIKEIKEFVNSDIRQILKHLSSREIQVAKRGLNEVTKHENRPVALLNIGNTCYINASLQILFSISEIRGIIQSMEQSPDNLLQQLRLLLDQPTKENLSGFRELLFKHQYSPFKDKDLNKPQEEDASEFLVFILGLLNWNPINLCKNFVLPGSPAVDDITTGNKIPDENHQKTSHISVCIQNVQNFQLCLNAYFDYEKIVKNKDNGESPLSIKDFGEHYQWWQGDFFQNPLPNFLIVQLKRFNNEGKKITTKIDFPDDGIVTVNDSDDNPVKYEIIAYINHHGRTIARGHYTADVKKICDEENLQKWFHCNDNKITPKDPSNSDTAYIVVLKKRER